MSADFIEQECPCGRVWRGRVNPRFGCSDCFPEDHGEPSPGWDEKHPADRDRRRLK